MFFERNNLYHPFLGNAIRIFLSNDSNDDGAAFHELIKDVNLYYQPVQVPSIATIFLIIKSLLLVATEYLLYKVYCLAKRENSLMKDVTLVFVYAQMVFWPVWIFFAASTDFIHPLNEVVGQWYCEAGSFLA